jgi:hypothetical protein
MDDNDGDSDSSEGDNFYSDLSPANNYYKSGNAHRKDHNKYLKQALL